VDVTRGSNRVAFLGRDEPRKGLDVLLEAWRTVSQVIPAAELVVMGAEREPAGINWMGLVDDTTKAEVLASTALFVAPNLGGESFGVILVEAMSAGAAVVASDLASFREVGGDAVRYFSTGSSGDLAGVLIALLGDANEVASMSRAGKARAAQFDWGTVATKYRAIYAEALS
jgi:phosphatidylinositol alpha-mannosyltransferase